MKFRKIILFIGAAMLLSACGRDAEAARDTRNADEVRDMRDTETAAAAEAPNATVQKDNTSDAQASETAKDSAEDNTEIFDEEDEEPIDDTPFDPTKIVSEFSIEYKAAIEEMRNTGTTPDKRRVMRPEGGSFSNTDYAVFDVDCDGTDELVLRYMDGGKDSFCAIYEYDVITTGFRCEFIEVMSLKPVFYDNATIKAVWQEDTGLNKEIPSFNIYTYDAAEDVYAYRGYVESWDLSAAADDTEGNAFPVKYDLDENGIVFSIQFDQDYEYSFIYDDADYRALSKSLYDAKQLHATWLSL